MLVSIRVVTEIEGSNSGDATTTSAHLRRSDRGGFPYDILYCICMITLACVDVGSRLLYPVGLVCLCVDMITSHYFAFVALSVRGCV